jgi:hypothetical protein
MRLRLTSLGSTLVFSAFPLGGVASLVERRKLAARVRHALRFCGMYLVSFSLLAILTAPLWIGFLIWWTWD